ncbi:hypothetical protein GCM10010331_49210 [Streptomyces xanthochromogenes]|uniref:hypothetical protein n=1 Tax=Streptomyces xanthochromogenes TaxID=67384 RepID=UPI0016778AB0|nr:hypothetical protein [Streptomyces xanthochromogenes]GHB55541.1 hypothetical protein GCM10010331_49210 [Streptomyces xanthochromogenes]
MAVNRGERAAMAVRRAKLVEYRRRKVPYSQFYEELGYANANAASRDFHRALEESIAEQHASVEVYREEQLIELDFLAEEAHKILRTRHYVINSGRIVEHPETGEPLEDDGPVLAAIDRLVKILDRIAKLRGLDAPQRLEVMTIDAIEAAIADLNEQLAASDAEAEAPAGTEGTSG